VPWILDAGNSSALPIPASLLQPVFLFTAALLASGDRAVCCVLRW
jgi:hypothetical protein